MNAVPAAPPAAIDRICDAIATEARASFERTLAAQAALFIRNPRLAEHIVPGAASMTPAEIERVVNVMLPRSRNFDRTIFLLSLRRAACDSGQWVIQ